MKSIKLTFTLLILTTQSWTQTSENITLVGRWPDGPCNAVITVDKTAYIGNGAAMDVLDIFEPDNPIKISRVVTPGVVNDGFIAGNYLYIANGKAGLRIIDIRTPASPHEIGHLATSGDALRVFVQGEHAYIAADTAGLDIIDVSRPLEPKKVKNIKLDGYTQDVFVEANHAYLTNSEEGLKIIDVSDPASPVEIGSFNFDIPTHVASVAVMGQYAYILSSPNQPLSRGALNILNIHNPDSLYEVARDIISGDWVSSGNKVVVRDGIAYVAFFSDVGSGLQTIDVSDPTNPATLGHYLSVIARDIFVDDKKRAYLADDHNGLTILDVNNPASIVSLGNYDTAGNSRDIFVLDRLGFIASDGLRVLDLTDPSNPLQLDHFEISPFSLAGKIFISNNLAFLTTNASLRILDISRPDSLFQIGSFGVLSRTVHVMDDYAFVLDRDKTLHIVDVNDPTAPRRISKYKTGGDRYVLGGDVFVSNNHAYVAATSSGLHILDISDVRNPVKKSSIEANGASLDVFVMQNHAYLAETGGLKIIDVSVPKSPQVVGQSDTSIAALSVFVAGDFAYVPTAKNGLRLFDISEPRFPVEVGFFKTGDVARGVRVANDLIYLVDNKDGLYILQNDLLTKIKNPEATPQNFVLHQNFPNPFNPSTEIRFELPVQRHVTLTVYNILGQKMKTLVDEMKQAGSYSVIWDGTDERSHPVPSGVYFYRFDAGVVSGTKKMILMR